MTPLEAIARAMRERREISACTVQEHGAALVPQAFDEDSVRTILQAIGPVDGAGRRRISSIPAIAVIARSARTAAILRPYFASPPRLVRALFFHKSAETNWFVTWHQDLTLALRRRSEAPGFGPWSVKDGIPHAHAPAELLAQMLTLRLHLDDADDTNGALRIIPGTHGEGRLTAERIEDARRRRNEVLCVAEAGDVLVMRPLLLHASGKSNGTRPRRVLHLEFADFELPAGLEWDEAI